MCFLVLQFCTTLNYCLVYLYIKFYTILFLTHVSDLSRCVCCSLHSLRTGGSSLGGRRSGVVAASPRDVGRDVPTATIRPTAGKNVKVMGISEIYCYTV